MMDDRPPQALQYAAGRQVVTGVTVVTEGDSLIFLIPPLASDSVRRSAVWSIVGIASFLSLLVFLVFLIPSVEEKAFHFVLVIFALLVGCFIAWGEVQSLLRPSHASWVPTRIVLSAAALEIWPAMAVGSGQDTPTEVRRWERVDVRDVRLNRRSNLFGPQSVVDVSVQPQSGTPNEVQVPWPRQFPTERYERIMRDWISGASAADVRAEFGNGSVGE